MPVAKITLHFLNAGVCFVPILAPLFLQHCGCPVPVTTQPAFIPASCCMEEHAGDSRCLFLLRLSAADLGMI